MAVFCKMTLYIFLLILLNVFNFEKIIKIDFYNKERMFKKWKFQILSIFLHNNNIAITKLQC
jgi:hypothetical protein